MTCLEALEYISRDLDGDLNENEKALLDEHIKNCPSCQKEYEEMKKIVESLRNEPMLDLPSGFHDELMEKIEKSKVVPFNKASKKPYYKKYAAIAAAIGVFAVVGITSGGFNLIGVNNNVSGTAQSVERNIENDYSSSSNEYSEEKSEDQVAAETENAAPAHSAEITPSMENTDTQASNESIDGTADENTAAEPNVYKNVPSSDTETSNEISGASEISEYEESGNTAKSGNTDSSDIASGVESYSMQQETAAEENKDVMVRGASQNQLPDAQKPMLAMAQVPNTIQVSLDKKEIVTDKVKEYVQSVNGTVDESVENTLNIAIPEESYSGLKTVIDENGTVLSNDAIEGQNYSSVVIEFK